MNQDLRKISEWAEKWIVKFNLIKTQYIFISNSPSEDDIRLLFQEKNLLPCSDHR